MAIINSIKVGTVTYDIGVDATNVSGSLDASIIPNLDASKITSGTLAIENGGTGATTAADARTALGVAASSHNHVASNINSGTLAIGRLPTSSTQTNSNSYIPTSALIYSMNETIVQLENSMLGYIEYPIDHIKVHSNASASGSITLSSFVCIFNTTTAKISFSVTFSGNNNNAYITGLIPPLTDQELTFTNGQTRTLQTTGYCKLGGNSSTSGTYTINGFIYQWA